MLDPKHYTVPRHEPASWWICYWKQPYLPSVYTAAIVQPCGNYAISSRIRCVCMYVANKIKSMIPQLEQKLQHTVLRYLLQSLGTDGLRNTLGMWNWSWWSTFISTSFLEHLSCYVTYRTGAKLCSNGLYMFSHLAIIIVHDSCSLTWWAWHTILRA